MKKNVLMGMTVTTTHFFFPLENGLEQLRN
jgi:hypothetical protein